MENDIVTVAQQLENAGKITREACVAILKGDEDTYSREMVNAAQKVIHGEKPYFLGKEEIKTLRNQYRQAEPATRDNADEKLFCLGAKYFFLHATGLTIPYLAYKAYTAISENKKTAGSVAAAIGLAAFIGLDADDIS